MLFHLRSASSQKYVKSQNELRLSADSPAAGHYEAFYVSVPGGLRDGASVELRAVGDNALLGLDPAGYLGSGRAPHVTLAVQKVGGKANSPVEDGDKIAFRQPRPSWWPWQRYVKATDDPGSLLRISKGALDSAAEFLFLKAREIARVVVPEQGSGYGKILLKDLAAPPGGVPIEVTSSHPDVIAVEKSVIVPEGKQEAQFQCVRLPGATAPAEVVITARAVATGDPVSVTVPLPAGTVVG